MVYCNIFKIFYHGNQSVPSWWKFPNKFGDYTSSEMKCFSLSLLAFLIFLLPILQKTDWTSLAVCQQKKSLAGVITPILLIGKQLLNVCFSQLKQGGFDMIKSYWYMRIGFLIKTLFWSMNQSWRCAVFHMSTACCFKT